MCISYACFSKCQRWRFHEKLFLSHWYRLVMLRKEPPLGQHTSSIHFTIFMNTFVFVDMGLYETKTSKRYSSIIKSLLNLFIFFRIFFPVVLRKVRFWIFEILSFWFFRIFFFSFSLTWDPMGAKIQNATPPSNHFWICSTFSWIFFSVVLTKVLFWLFEILNFRFLTNFWISPFYPLGKPKTSIIWKTSDRGAKRSEIWASGVSIQCIQGPFDS